MLKKKKKITLALEFSHGFPALQGCVCLSCSFHALLQLLGSTWCLSLGSVLGRGVLVARGTRQSAVGNHSHPTLQQQCPVPRPWQLKAGV